MVSPRHLVAMRPGTRETRAGSFHRPAAGAGEANGKGSSQPCLGGPKLAVNSLLREIQLPPGRVGIPTGDKAGGTPVQRRRNRLRLKPSPIILVLSSLPDYADLGAPGGVGNSYDLPFSRPRAN